MEFFFEIIDGELPPGLSLNQTDGFISGVATEGGIFSFVIKASSPENELEGVQTVYITAGEGGPVDPDEEWLELSGGNLEDGYVGKGYSVFIGVSASGPMYTEYNVVDGTLPPGIDFDNGTISGVPTESGNYTFTVTVSNVDGTITSSAPYYIKIHE
jgi:hypothetical protein